MYKRILGKRMKGMASSFGNVHDSPPYILTEKKIHQQEMPLLSAYDIRQVIIQIFIKKGNDYEEVEAQIKYRHKKKMMISYEEMIKPNVPK